MSVVYWARFFREEDGAWSVDVPDMPGCLTWGETFEEAFQYLTREAIPGWLGNAPWPPARSPEEILALDHFEGDREPLLARIALSDLPDPGNLIQHPDIRADLQWAAELEGLPVGEILALAAREYLDRHHSPKFI